MENLIEYIPIITTVFATFFSVVMFRHYMERKKPYLLWWFIGIVTFALGTLTESINALGGWNETNLRAWYITGALLGGFPLAQGSVYLLMKRKFADLSSIFWVAVIVTAAVCVSFSPILDPATVDYKLTGKILAWRWVRYFSPFINLYALVFLVGGAIYSAIRYRSGNSQEARFKGNIFIAIGGLLPGIGGTFTRFGHVNVLFVTELIGLFLIFVGYRIIRSEQKQVIAEARA
jgi:hypothetical protein